MKVNEVKAALVSVPLDAPVRNGTDTITLRDYVIVRALASDGSSGVACGLARGLDLVTLINRALAPLCVGRGVHEPRTISRTLWAAVDPQLVTTTQVARSISLVDIALWDLHAKSVGLPIATLLGAKNATSVPVLAASGYYRHDDEKSELEAVENEYSDLRAQGFRRMKIMAGAADPAFDSERILAAYSAAGMPVAVDVNGAWETADDAIALVDRIPGEAIDFIEEPFPSRDFETLRFFRDCRSARVAVGEWEAGHEYFRRLMSDRLIDIARLDVTAIGGVSEWLNVAALAEAYEISILPHYFPHFHAPLVTLAPTAEAVEVISANSGAENFDRLLRSTAGVERGEFPISTEPGFGIDWDWDRIEIFTRAVN